MPRFQCSTFQGNTKYAMLLPKEKWFKGDQILAKSGNVMGHQEHAVDRDRIH